MKLEMLTHLKTIYPDINLFKKRLYQTINALHTQLRIFVQEIGKTSTIVAAIGF